MGTALDGFVKVLYDDSHRIGGRIAKHFGVSAFPTLLVLDAEGQEVDEVWGRDPAEFVKELARIQRGEDTLLSFQSRLAADPDDIEAVVELAERNLMRHPDVAERLAAEALAKLPAEAREERAQLLMIRASFLAGKGQIDPALDLFERILVEFEDTKAATHVGLELANHIHDADPERALDLLGRAMPLVEEEYRSHLAGTRRFLYQNAILELVRKEAKQAHDNGEWLNQIAWDCYERGWLVTEALAWAHRAVELTDRAPHVLDTLACLLFKSGRLSEAIRVQAEALLRVEDEAMRAELEENMARFYAVKRLREKRRDARGAR